MSERTQRTSRPELAADLVPEDRLIEQLRPMLLSRGYSGDFEAIKRTPNVYTSSCPSEIVQIHAYGQESIPLFCKYDFVESNEHTCHRSGVEYEARVNEEILEPLGVTVPDYYGCFEIPGRRGRFGLVVAALESPQRVSKSGSSHLIDAATWIGDFHRQTCDLVTRRPFDFLIHHDIQRVESDLQLVRSRASAQDIPWIEQLARRLKARLDETDSPEECIIHGEFYPANVLVSNQAVYPIDWESAGVGAGEIDLASLTMGWPKDLVEQCMQAYCSQRWSRRASQQFRSRVQIATIYLCLRMFTEHDHSLSQPLPSKLLHFLKQSAKDNDFLLPGGFSGT